MTLTMTLTEFLQHLANGVSLGSLYALIAIGYTMVYGIIRLVNFAHGDLLMVATYVAFYGMILFSLPWPLAFLLAVAVTTLPTPEGRTADHRAYFGHWRLFLAAKSGAGGLWRPFQGFLCAALFCCY